MKSGLMPDKKGAKMKITAFSNFIEDVLNPMTLEEFGKLVHLAARGCNVSFCHKAALDKPAANTGELTSE